VHEFHVWQLSGSRIIATAHIRCGRLLEYARIADQVKAFFHMEGIHSTTIQMEFVEVRLTDKAHTHTYTYTRLTAFFQDNLGKQAPER